MKRTLVLIVLLGAIACNKGHGVPERKQFPQVPESALKGVTRTNLDHPRPSAEQVARRDRSLGILKGLGVPYLATLPVIEEARSIKPRTATEIANRCVAVAICAVKGETHDQKLADELTERFGAGSLFSPREAAFIKASHPAPQELTDATWGYEAVHVLLWSLGYIDQMEPPNKMCDVPSDVAILRKHERGLAAGAHPRAMAELLDQADLYYHLHWSAIELRLRGRSSPSLDEDIIRERHRALNWLIRYMNQDWDDVTTDT